MYNSLKYILENDPEPLCVNFSVNKEVLGEVIILSGNGWGRKEGVKESTSPLGKGSIAPFTLRPLAHSSII